jgi:hypothetical protein
MSTRKPMIRSLAGPVLLGLALIALSGCVSSAWNRALEEDTPAAYLRFMRDHGDSKYAESARERLDFHKLKRNPTLAGYEQFRRSYPDSDLFDDLRPVLEEPAFEAARARGTAEAYRKFARSFPGGEYAARAEGDAVYVENAGFGGDPDRLASFAKRHPASDFAAEAARTAESVALRREGRFDRVGVVFDIPPSTPQRSQIRAALLDHIRKRLERVELGLVEVSDSVMTGSTSAGPMARLEVRHRESTVDSGVSDGQISQPLRLGQTELVLRDRPGGSVIGSRRFEIRLADKAHVPGTSVLFSPAAKKYWNEFFVPVARWRNDQTIRPPITLGRAVVDVDAVGDRTAVLYEDGDFDVLGLADPTSPVRIASYQRDEDYKKWSGIRILGDAIAIYGEEGLEIVRFERGGPVVERSFPRGDIGRVLAVAPLADRLVVVGAKGMQLLDRESGAMRRVMRRVVLGVAVSGDTLVFVDGEAVYLSNLQLLAQNRVIAQMKLGRTFGPDAVRILDRAAIVTGPGGAIVIDLRDPARPKALAKVSSREVGEIGDATQVRGRVFLVGERGLQVLSRGLDHVEETVDVGARDRVTVMGRHLVTAGAEGLQVVDATPWAEVSVPAAPR